MLLIGFAAGRLILRCRNGQHARWDYERLWDQETSFWTCASASLAVMFLLSYFAVMGIQLEDMNYNINARRQMAALVLDYLGLDLLACLFMAVVLGRIYMILRGRTAPWLLWDGLAIGGVAYFFAYLYLGMFTAYYLAPVDLIAVLYVGRSVLLSWKNTQSWRKAAALMLAFAVVLQDVSLFSFCCIRAKERYSRKG